MDEFFEMKKIFLFLAIAFFAYSCAGVNNKNQKCVVDGYSLKKSGQEEITFSFVDNSACVYNLEADTERAWIIHIPQVQFGKNAPSVDEFSASYINKIQTIEQRVEIYFNAPFKVSIKNGGSFVFTKIDTPAPAKAGTQIKAVWCNGVPFLMRVDSDGAVSYSFGVIEGKKSYLDINGVVLGEEFSVPSECGLITLVSELEFPKRVRFIVNNPKLPYLQIYGDGSSVFAEETLEDKIVKHSYILDIVEVNSSTNQTIYVYVSGNIMPQMENIDEDTIKISLGGRFRPVANVGRRHLFTGVGFSSLNIAESEDYITLKADSSRLLNVRLEKNDLGFVVYSKLRQK